jgi:ferredoxin
MVYVITSACVKDEVCVSACPEEAIASGTVDVAGESFDQFFIDPDKCIDCGTCEAVCPETAIFSEDDLSSDDKKFIGINAAFFKK